MLEPAVTLTDYILAAEALIFCILIARQSELKRKSNWWLILFLSLCVASLTGGTVHGFFPDHSSPAWRPLWTVTLLSLGAMSFGAWNIGVNFMKASRFSFWLKKISFIQLFIFCVVVIFYSQQFIIAALNYLPAAIFLLIVFTKNYLQNKNPAALSGIVSIILTFCGSAVQIAHIASHSVYFNYNVIYHGIQFLALIFLYRAAQGYSGAKDKI